MMSYDTEQALRDAILKFKESHRVWDTITVEITNDKIKIRTKEESK